MTNLGIIGQAAGLFAVTNNDREDDGGDNIGVYVPVFATSGTGGMTVYAVVFLVLVAVWVAAGRFLATRPVIAKVLGRWGHILLPVVLIGIGVLILVEGGAFGL